MPSGHKIAGSPYEMVRGDGVASRDANRGDLQAADVRGRYRFQCKLCGLAAVARSETFRPVLFTLRDAGMDEISLGALKNRLMKEQYKG